MDSLNQKLYIDGAVDSHSKNHLQACKDRLRALNNAIERSDPERVPNSVRREAH
ncbi:hypothetical protein N9850_12980 [Granulosicoccus sp.]|nr:hypothetical protein [Granulosicoccus sp.]MDB4224680.1 hypothetical protein [Granulosicoccus sp.]